MKINFFINKIRQKKIYFDESQFQQLAKLAIKEELLSSTN
jgi:hypothetical protein